MLQHLIAEGVHVYLLDHRSTDATVGIAETFLARGVLAIEPFPADHQSPSASQFAWKEILARKAEVSTILDADWFIHHDADEFRESPWIGDRLVDAIHRVDAAGYNAIDFALLNFWPTNDRFEPGTDPREGFAHYTPGETWDRPQIKCWKKSNGMPDLVSSGGHDVQIPDRRVFPVRFVLRHYPIRGQQHGERKVFRERRPRFVRDEIEAGWHVQYASLGESPAFIRSPDMMTHYDANSVRLGLALEHRGVEDLRTALATATVTIRERSEAIESLTNTVDELRAHLERALNDLSAERNRRADAVQEIVRLRHEIWRIQTQQREIDRLGRDIDRLQRELSALYASRSWRWTAVLRWLHERLSSPASSREPTTL